MKFLKKIRDIKGLSKSEMAKGLGSSIQRYIYMETKGKGLALAALCKLKKVSCLSWEQVGKLIEKEFGK